MRRAQDRARSATIKSRALGALNHASEASCAQSARKECAREAGRFFWYINIKNNWKFILFIFLRIFCTNVYAFYTGRNICIVSIHGYIKCTIFNIWIKTLPEITYIYNKTLKMYESWCPHSWTWPWALPLYIMSC